MNYILIKLFLKNGALTPIHAPGAYSLPEGTDLEQEITDVRLVVKEDITEGPTLVTGLGKVPRGGGRQAGSQRPAGLRGSKEAQRGLQAEGSATVSQSTQRQTGEGR